MFNQFKACDCIQVSRLKVFDGLWVIKSADFIVSAIYTYIRIRPSHPNPYMLFKSTNIETNHIVDL